MKTVGWASLPKVSVLLVAQHNKLHSYRSHCKEVKNQGLSDCSCKEAAYQNWLQNPSALELA